MSSPDMLPAGPARVAGSIVRHRMRLLARLAVVGLLSGALAGCFQPLYADNATVGGPGLQHRLQDVEVMEINGRLGYDLREELIFLLSGGAGNPKGAPLQLYIAANSTATTALIDAGSGLPQSMIIRVAANWRLVRADDEKKRPVAGGTAVATSSIDTSDQRFANYSAKNEGDARAAREVAEQIKAQLAAYFMRIGDAPAKPQPAKASGS